MYAEHTTCRAGLACPTRHVLVTIVIVRVADKHSWEEKESIKNIIKKYQEELGDNGQILVRASGTEPLIRIMAEGPQQERLEEIASAIAEVVTANWDNWSALT